MYDSSSRSFTTGARTGFLVLLAAAMLVLTPRPASAASLICLVGQCQFAPGNCALYTPLPAGYTCTSPIPGRISRLVAGAKDASVIIDLKPVLIVTDKMIEIFERWQKSKPPTTSPEYAKVELKFNKSLDALFGSTKREVSTALLSRVGKEPKLPVPPRPVD